MVSHYIAKLSGILLVGFSIAIIVSGDETQPMDSLPTHEEIASSSSDSNPIASNTPSQVSSSMRSLCRSMKPLLDTLCVASLLLGAMVPAQLGAVEEDRCTPIAPCRDQPYVSGYFPSWGIDNQNFTPFDVAVEELTHVTYAFASIADGVIGNFDKETDIENEITNPDPAVGPKVFKGAFDAMNNPLSPFRRRNPSIRTLISIGGWTLSKYFSDVALSEQSRRKFSSSVASFIRQHGFDGVDIDWEYPTGGGDAGNIERPEDVDNFAKLLAALRAALTFACKTSGRSDPYLLTAATPAFPDGYKIPQLLPSVDWFNVMTYDFYGPSWATETGYNSPLDRINKSIQGYLANGIPPNRILLGVPFYGYAYGGVKVSSAGSSFHESLSQGDGTVMYSDVAANDTSAQGYKAFWDPIAKVPYLWNKEKEIWVSAENPLSIWYKAKLAKEFGIQGAFVWELSNDNNLLLRPLSANIKSCDLPSSP